MSVSMHQELWDNIQNFTFDSSEGDYSFRTRLADENEWTIFFTEQAILEYKKFMYLAASVDFMVAPSAIVDIVWHQHLLFSQSYQSFCNLIGKQVQHIPSTHQVGESEKFIRAQQQTKTAYEKHFGKQPRYLWEQTDMMSSLNLEKSRLKLRTLILIGLLLFACLTVPAFFWLEDSYATIDNPYFIAGFIPIAVTAMIVLFFINRYVLNIVISRADDSSFIFQLDPSELIYLQKQKIFYLIHGIVNQLIGKGAITVHDNNTLKPGSIPTDLSQYEIQVLTTLTGMRQAYYPNLLQNVSSKPLFTNIRQSMYALEKHIIDSKIFRTLFSINFFVLGMLSLFAFTRIITGLHRDKPVTFIILLTIIFTLAAVHFLYRLTKMPGTQIIPSLYRHKVLPERNIENHPDWMYFLLGTAVITSSFAPLVKYHQQTSSDGFGGASCSSGGSSCGSACSSCGGCGGGD